MPTKCYKYYLRVLQFHYANMNPSIKNHFSLLLLATILLSDDAQYGHLPNKKHSLQY